MLVLRVNETKRTCTNAFPVDSFALECRKGSRSEERTLFLDSSWSLCLSLNPYPLNDATWRFFKLIRFDPFFCHLLFLLEKKTKSIRFCTKFYLKVATILRAKWSSLLLGSKPVQQNQLHFLKSFGK